MPNKCFRGFQSIFNPADPRKSTKTDSTNEIRSQDLPEIVASKSARITQAYINPFTLVLMNLLHAFSTAQCSASVPTTLPIFYPDFLGSLGGLLLRESAILMQGLLVHMLRIACMLLHIAFMCIVYQQLMMAL